MTRSQIFAKAHKEAKFNKTNHRDRKHLSYPQNLSLALKEVWITAKKKIAEQKEAAKFGDVDKYMVDALKAIQEGGKWNGVVYTKKRGVNDMLLSVYVDSKYFGMCQVHKSEATKEIARFEKAAKKLVITNSNQMVDSGAGYMVSKRNLHKVAEYGYDGIEELD